MCIPAALHTPCCMYSLVAYHNTRAMCWHYSCSCLACQVYPMCLCAGPCLLVLGYRCFRLCALKSCVLNFLAPLWSTGSVFDKLRAAPLDAWMNSGSPQYIWERDETALRSLWNLIQFLVLFYSAFLAALAVLVLLGLLARLGLELTCEPPLTPRSPCCGVCPCFCLPEVDSLDAFAWQSDAVACRGQTSLPLLHQLSAVLS